MIMKIVALAGGVGGAKFAHGLAQALPPENLSVIVNTGDDFEHLGLYICPDLDTVCYTLGGFANPDTGWGRVNESWNTIANIEKLGGPSWFRLGDRDFATHIERTRRLKSGQTLSRIVRGFCISWGIKQTVLPMSNEPVRTIVDTLEHGELPFQDYFVRLHCEPKVKGFRFDGIEQAQPAQGVLGAIKEADAVVICPSNPWVSIQPILAVAGIRSALEAKPVVAISPIIGGRTVKGPAAKMYQEFGIAPSALAVAEHYRGLLKGFVLDTVDSELAEKINVQTLVINTIMNSISDRARLANDVLHFLRSL